MTKVEVTRKRRPSQHSGHGQNDLPAFNDDDITSANNRHQHKQHAAATANKRGTHKTRETSEKKTNKNRAINNDYSEGQGLSHEDIGLEFDVSGVSQGNHLSGGSGGDGQDWSDTTLDISNSSGSRYHSQRNSAGSSPTQSSDSPKLTLLTLKVASPDTKEILPLIKRNEATAVSSGKAGPESVIKAHTGNGNNKVTGRSKDCSTSCCDDMSFKN